MGSCKRILGGTLKRPIYVPLEHPEPNYQRIHGHQDFMGGHAVYRSNHPRKVMRVECLRTRAL